MSAEPAVTVNPLSSVHVARTMADLRLDAARHFRRLLPNGSAVLLLHGSDDASVELVHGDLGDSYPLESRVPRETEDDTSSIPMHYGEDLVGELRYRGDIEEESAAELAAFVAQLTIALVNLKLNAEALRTTEHYCASLQAFEEGVVLFQERDVDTVGARFLTLFNSLLGTPIGALLVLDRIGDVTADLRLSQVQGLPEHMLEEFRTTDGSWWPSTVVDRPVGIESRDAETGEFESLDASGLPPAMRNVVHCPLRYHGVNVGLALAFNVASDDPSYALKLERVRRLGELGAALFHRLSLEQESLRSREFETQLSIAATIQSRFIPAEAPQSDKFLCAWRSKPAQHIGGDYVDLLRDEEGRVHAIIADVSGHGINSALLMASCRAGYRSACDRSDPHELLAKMNNDVATDVGDTGMFITAAALRFDPSGRRCQYASAGHNALFLYRADRGEVELLESTGPSLGMFAGLDYDLEEVELQKNDVLLLYTDGIVEATDGNNEMFGDDRLIEALKSHSERKPDEIMNAIEDAVANFTGGQPADDDISIMVIRVLE